MRVRGVSSDSVGALIEGSVVNNTTCERHGQLRLDAFEDLTGVLRSSVVSHDATRIGRLGQKLGPCRDHLMNEDICIPRKRDEILAGSRIS